MESDLSTLWPPAPQPQSSASTTTPAPDPTKAIPQSQPPVALFNRDTLQQRLQALIEGARESWTYAIFWQSSFHYSDGTVLGWGDGYYNGEEDEGKGKAKTLSFAAEQEHRKKVLRELNSGTSAAPDDAVDEEVTDTEWFFLVSMTQSFVNGGGLPGQAFFNSSPVWVTGPDRLSASTCERARQGQVFGLQTLVCIPSANGVVELGSTELIFQNSDLMNKVRILFNFNNLEMGLWPLNGGADQADSDPSSENSPCSSGRIWKYDVFLSFRGEDTRYSFIDHLFAALHRRAVITFKDDMKLKKGKIISQELFKAIEESQVCVVVLSKDYAASTWCLDELAKIVDCNEQVDRNQTILPVFYDVDPSEVRKQSGSFREAFARHEETFRNSDKVQRWRKALTKVGNLSGWDARNKPEAQVVEEIVKVARSVLGHKLSSFTDELVGIQSRLEILNMHMALGLNDVRYIGIIGMPGVGKTTLAKILYDRICHHFDASSFLENVNKGSEDDCLINLQKQLLYETLQEDIRVLSQHKGTKLISSRLRNMKSLIILDNVEQSCQLEKLAGKRDWFGKGSRIIITTRDEQILREYEMDHVYKVELLNIAEDVQFFCRKAFKRDYPLEDYERLTDSVLKYCNGLPLAIKVLGSFLFGKSVLEWISALARLRENPNKEIINVLRTSFDGLEPTEKEMFLDIACFLRGMPVCFVKDMQNNHRYYPDIGMRILIDKSLIVIVDGFIQMHDLLQELAKKIIMEKSPKEPGKWSRLWSYEHLQHITRENSATEDIEVLALHGLHSKEIELKAETLSKMSRLRILKLDGMKISRNLVGLSREIQLLSLTNYPDTCLPHPLTHSSSIFQLDRLVELWEGIKPLNNLRILNLSGSKNLVKTPDFRGMPNLKRMFLVGCASLMHVDESIRVLSKLEELDLRECGSLVSLPSSIFRLTCLRILNLNFCQKLENLFVKTSDAECPKEFVEKSTFTSTIVPKAVMSPFRFFPKRQKQLSEPLLNGLRSLQSLSLCSCNLRELPDAIGWMKSLISLNLSGNKFVRLPSTINELSRLAYLNLSECQELQCLPKLPVSTDADFSMEKLSSDRISNVMFGSLYIYNCPKLVENDIQPYTKLALSWLAKLVQVPHDPDRRVDIVIPGNDVPKWFNHQSLGGSTRVPLPYSSEWIGIALCVAPVPKGNNFLYNVVYNDFEFVVGLCGTQKTIGMLLYSKLEPTNLPVSFKSDHLWLLYLPREMSICRILKTWEAGKEVEFRVISKHFKVEKFGARWMAEQDIQVLQFLKEQC